MSGSNLIYLSALARVRESDDGEPATTAAAGGDGAGASVSTDTESTAALKEVQQTEQGGRADRQSAGARPSSDGGAHQQAGIKPRPSIPPKPVNDDFPRIQVIGSH